MYVHVASWDAVREYGVPLEAGERLVRTYGSRWRKVLDPARDRRSLAEPLPGAPALLVLIRCQSAIFNSARAWGLTGPALASVAGSSVNLRE